jgi:RimJ/RimL family protein N-acetyltransferase
VFDFLTYRQPTANDAKMLLDWRTAPHVTQFMLTDVPYDIERQKAWIERSNARDDYHHRIMQCEGRDIGYTSITITDCTSSIGEIGIYIGDLQAPHALTVYNFVHTLNHAFFTLRLHKLVNHIVAWNSRTIRIQTFNGYRHVGVLKDHTLKDGVRHDLHIFEQSADEWRAFRKKFKDTADWDGNATE